MDRFSRTPRPCCARTDVRRRDRPQVLSPATSGPRTRQGLSGAISADRTGPGPHLQEPLGCVEAEGAERRHDSGRRAGTATSTYLATTTRAPWHDSSRSLRTVSGTGCTPAPDRPQQRLCDQETQTQRPATRRSDAPQALKTRNGTAASASLRPASVPNSVSNRPRQPHPATSRTATPAHLCRSGQIGRLRHRTREQRIQSVQAKLTLRHPKMNVSAAQRPALVGRVGLEPTADGL